MAKEALGRSHFPHYESLGETEVRRRLIAGHYGFVGPSHNAAVEWLNLVSSRDNSRIARSAKNAAWAAAIAAIIAAICAIVTIWPQLISWFAALS